MIKLTKRSPARSEMGLWLVLIFLFATNFMSAGGYLLLAFMAFYSIIHLREFSFRIPEVFLFVFAAEYFLFYFLWYRGVSVRSLCNYLVAPWLLYWIGRNMACRSEEDDPTLRIATVAALGFFVYGLLCVIYSIRFAPPAAGSRVVHTFWDHTPLSATASGLLFSMAAGVAVGELTAKSTGWKRLFWLAVLGGCLYYSFSWACRTIVYIVVILIAYNFFAYLLAMRTTSARKLGLLFGVVLLAAAAIICLTLDVGGCWTWLQGQWLFQRLTNSAAAKSTSRLLIWGEFFRKFLLYPLGGKQFNIHTAYVHNMWLDVYYICGILPFIALVVVTVIIVRNFFRFRKGKLKSSDSRSVHVLANFYLSAFLAFMVEPIISANPYVFLAVILVSGSMDGAIQKAIQHPVQAP